MVEITKIINVKYRDNPDEYRRRYSAEWNRRVRPKIVAERRKIVLEMLGDKCVKCGAKGNLHIDHKDPRTKKFQLSGHALTRGWGSILEEIKKCQILCNICHGIKSNSERINFSESNHGMLSMYTNNKCRCKECRSAWAKYYKDLRYKKRLLSW